MSSGVLPKVLTETALREQFAELRRALVAGIDTPDRPNYRGGAGVAAGGSSTRCAGRRGGCNSAAASARPMGMDHRQHCAGYCVRHDGFVVAASHSTPNPERGDRRAAPGYCGTVGYGRRGSDFESINGEHNAGQEGERAGRRISRERGLEGRHQWAPTTGIAASHLRGHSPTEAKPLVISVPYGADALGGPRLDLIRQIARPAGKGRSQRRRGYQVVSRAFLSHGQCQRWIFSCAGRNSIFQV